jgi:hypothetical protein
MDRKEDPMDRRQFNKAATGTVAALAVASGPWPAVAQQRNCSSGLRLQSV